MAHEEDGHTRKNMIALDVICRENGHKYRVNLKEKPKGCPQCGCKDYDIENEIYEGEG